MSDTIASSQYPSIGHLQVLPATPPGPVPPNTTKAVLLTSGAFEVARRQNAILGGLLK